VVQFELFLVIAPFAVLLTVLTLVFLLTHIHKGRFLTLFGLLLCVTGLLVGNVLELLAKTPESLLFFSRFTYTALVFTPVFWLLFALEFVYGTTHKLLHYFWALSIIPLLTIFVALTNPVYHLQWADNSIQHFGPWLVNVVHSYGPWFYVHALYCYVLYLAGVFVVFKEYFERSRIYRRQSLLAIFAISFPIAVNFVYILRLIPGIIRDYSPLALAVSSGCMFQLVYRYRLIDTSSPAQAATIHDMDSAVLVLDSDGRVLDFNQKASQLLQGSAIPIPGAIAGWSKPLLADASNWKGHKKIVTIGGQSVVCDVSTISSGSSRHAFLVTVHGFDVADVGALNNEESLPAEDFPHLTKTEQKIALLLTRLCSNKEIAVKLSISENTAKTHVRNILRKSGVNNRALFAEQFRKSLTRDV